MSTYVSLDTPQYGSAVATLCRLVGHCLGVVAFQQMAIGSPFLAELNTNDDTPGSLRYVSIYTALDTLVQPTDRARLADAAINVKLQARCPFRIVGHLGLLFDGAVYGIVRSALHGGPVSTRCLAF